MLLQPKTRGWWIVVLGMFAVVVTFLALEVYDLDGSPLAHRLVQAPMASPILAVDSEVVMRSAPTPAQPPVDAVAFASLAVPLVLFLQRRAPGLRRCRVMPRPLRRPAAASLSSGEDTSALPQRP